MLNLPSVVTDFHRLISVSDDHTEFIDTWHVTDHLGSVRAVVDISGSSPSSVSSAVLEQNRYYPFGERTGDESGRYLYGARFYDPLMARWTTPNPLAEKYYGISPYAFCNNNPVNFVDPDGRDGIYINFPDYVISVGNIQLENLGHSGILLINNQTGLTKYYEYGRYDKQNRGIVRNIKVPNVVLGEDGKPTKESLDIVFNVISHTAGHDGRIEGAYVESNEFEVMNDYAQSLMAENENRGREKYNIMSNNCSTFAEEVLKQDESIRKKSPTSLFNIPNSVVKKWQKEFTPISYYNKIE